MSARITTAALAETVASQGESISALVESQKQTNALLAALVNAQHATPAAVAEAVAAPAAAAPVVEDKPKRASDLLKEFVESKNLAFARGGRVHLTTEALQAAVRVLRTGTPEILSVTGEGVGSLDKRHVTHLAIGLSDDKKSVITQYVFTPEA